MHQHMLCSNMDESGIQEVHSPYFDMHALVMYMVTQQRTHNIMEYSTFIIISVLAHVSCLSDHIFDASTEAFLHVTLKSW